MDAIIKIIALVFVIHFIKEIYEKNNTDVKTDTNQAYTKNSTSTKKDNKKLVDFYIRPLGEVDETDLSDAVKILRDFYQYNCIIKPRVDISENMKIQGTDEILSAKESLDELSHYGNTIFIADKRLWHLSECKGFTNGTSIIVKGDKSIMKETLLHEIGHTLGLNHCDKRSCIMAINNDEYETGNFCKKCRKKANQGLRNRRKA
jgi:predicted Zn-dependent protease